MTRQNQFDELIRLLSLRDMSRHRAQPERIDYRVDAAINQIMDELYGEQEPECTGNPLTCEREDCCQDPEFKDVRVCPELYKALMDQSEHITDELLDELEDDEVEYMDLSTVLKELSAKRGLKAARRGWDNVANMEYIEHAPFVGPVKVYQTSNVRPRNDETRQLKSYFKNVIHTFEPTRDDEQARDWYFL